MFDSLYLEQPTAAATPHLSHTTHTQVALLPSLLTLDTVFAVAVLQGGGAGAAAGRRFAGPGGLELCLGSLPLPTSGGGGGGGGVDAGRQPPHPADDADSVMVELVCTYQPAMLLDLAA